jgi:hypothetical protein
VCATKLWRKEIMQRTSEMFAVISAAVVAVSIIAGCDRTPVYDPASLPPAAMDEYADGKPPSKPQPGVPMRQVAPYPAQAAANASPPQAQSAYQTPLTRQAANAVAPAAAPHPNLRPGLVPPPPGPPTTNPED